MLDQKKDINYYLKLRLNGSNFGKFLRVFVIVKSIYVYRRISFDTSIRTKISASVVVEQYIFL